MGRRKWLWERRGGLRCLGSGYVDIERGRSWRRCRHGHIFGIRYFGMGGGSGNQLRAGSAWEHRFFDSLFVVGFINGGMASEAIGYVYAAFD